MSSIRRHWPLDLFRTKHIGQLIPGELVWRTGHAYPNNADGPYRVERTDSACPGQIFVNIVGMESSGTFRLAWGFVLVPRYR